MILENKVAIITGGSRGIGLATVKAFLRNGAVVVLTASTLENAEKSVAKLREEFPNSTIEGIAPDLTCMDCVKKDFEAVAEKFGRLDIVVNNAGVSESTALDNYTEELFDKVVNLNLKGVFTSSKAAANIMEKQGHGVILNTSSMVSVYGQPSGFAYPASKFAVNGVTLSLARELGQHEMDKSFIYDIPFPFL